ncbi:type II secretion system protein E [Aliidongia dinghuensis]|uniref:Type II secretion system protein E n=1 Tax=Aliidongia dinghuensis TaxID=1867774 RepID=A0A8J2YZ98_9PROT|nr:ATPase, T2SS/T4P/T4SS family [Aliidongia dinghuensis]GGF36560.1 type II secretion system protein E [Aliidongia dinghuensis]
MVTQGAERRLFERAVADGLIERGKLDPAAFDRALRLQAGTEERLEALLIKLGFAGERDVAEVVAAELGLPLAGPVDYPAEPVLADRLNTGFLHQNGIVPLSESADELALAMVDPFDDHARRAMALVVARAIRPLVAIPSELEAAYQRLYRPAGPQSDETPRSGVGDDDELLEDADRLRDLASEAPVIKLVGQLIARAVEARASDIHIEPFQNRLAVRYRIDGQLRDVEAPPFRLRAAITSRIKIMAKLNIAERRLPQDGRIRTTVQGQDYDLRVSTSPTLYGESVVLRILDRSSLAGDLPSLGFEPPLIRRYCDLLDRPQGILLVTGPTGSGKTTTLYTSLMRLNAPEKKLFTVEDPVEYQVDGVNQIQVKPQIGLDFASVLRSILRQDPDVVMIGEMRDLETAQIAVQAALTGHLVLSTLHTNGAAATIARLIDMGVDNYLVTSTVTGIWAQRLVRRLCPACAEPYQAAPELARELRLPETAGPLQFHRARGCAACHGTGYRGRFAVAELLVMSDPIRRLVLRRAEAAEIHRLAVEEGMVPMFEDGLAKALAGVTTLEEVLLVTREP